MPTCTVPLCVSVDHVHIGWKLQFPGLCVLPVSSSNSNWINQAATGQLTGRVIRACIVR
jgi:hypothetical protein